MIAQIAIFMRFCVYFLVMISCLPWCAHGDGTIAIQVSPSNGSWSLPLYPPAYSNATSGIGNLATVTAPTGTYSVAFGSLTNYWTPAAQTNTIVSNELATFTGYYIRVGSIAIQVSPTNGSWQLKAFPANYQGPTNGTGNLDATEAPTGTYSAAFGLLTGYRAPAPQTNAVISNELVTLSGIYIQNLAPLDFDGDRRTDAAVFNPDTGYWSILLSGNNSLLYGQLGWNETRPVPGDYDGDRRADAAVFHRQTGIWYIFQSATSNLLTGQLSWGDGHPVPGDYDGDQRTDAAVFDRNTGDWLIFQSSVGHAIVGQFGWGNARPVPGDYDGDGRTDIAFYDRDTGNWHIFQSSTSNTVSCNLGQNDARPAPGDYNGDGRTDVAMYYRAFGLWYIMNTNGTLDSFQFGWNEARAAPGDYDGDGCVDAAVYNRQTGTWYARSSATGETLTGQFGSSATAALPSFDNGGIEGLVMLAFGDSITYGSASSSDGPSTGYPVLLERILEPAFGGHFISINAGNPGETTEEALGRFEATLVAADPDIVLLMEGTNDEFFGVPYDQTEDNLRYMVFTAQRHGVQVVIATIPPVISNQYRNRSGQQARIQAFNPRIYQIAADYGIPLALVYESITAVPGWEQNLMHQPSANHPNDAGYQFVRDAFFDAVADGINYGLFY